MTKAKICYYTSKQNSMPQFCCDLWQLFIITIHSIFGQYNQLPVLLAGTD